MTKAEKTTTIKLPKPAIIAGTEYAEGDEVTLNERQRLHLEAQSVLPASKRGASTGGSDTDTA